MKVKNAAAVALGALGCQKGGYARAESLSKEKRRQIAIKAAKAKMRTMTPAQRSEVARKASVARWKKARLPRPAEASEPSV